MGKVKKGVKKFQKKIAGGGVHKKKKLHFRRDKADAAKAAEVQEQSVAAQRKKSEKAKPAKRAPAELNMDDFLNGGFMSVDAQQDQLSDSGDSEGEAGDDAATVDSDAEQDAHDMTSAAADAGSASESDDDDADVEADPVRAQNKQYKTEIASHQAQLEALRQQDPEFYEYLQQTDQELLKFGQDDDEEEEGSMEDASEDEQEATSRLPMEGTEEQEQPSTSGQQKHVSRAMVEAWCNAAKANASPAAMHKLLQAYRLACHYGDTEEQVHETMKISSSAVFNKLMLFVLKEGHHIFLRMLSLDELTTVTARDVQRSKRMKKVEGLLKSFLGNSLHLLGQMTDSVMLTFTLRRLRASVVLLAPFVKLQRKFLLLHAVSGEQCAAHSFDLTQPGFGGAACRTANMNVVDLTDGTHDDPLNVSQQIDGDGSARFDSSPSGLSQPRLGPKAAAAMQTGAKRKLPDSFQQQSAKSKQSNQQAPAGRSNVRAAPPPAVRHPAVRITATQLTQGQAVALPAQDFPAGCSQAKSTLPASETATHSAATHSTGTTPLLLEHALPVLDQPASQASYAQRRMPKSHAKVTSGSSTLSHTKAVGLRHVPATAANKAGPSEHDTKAALRAALEGLQMSGGKELNAPAGRMAIPLMRHQRLALAWMLHRERTAANPRGGILADDQGLGKTVSTIALIVTNQSGDDVADDGFEDLDSDEEDAGAEATANAAAPVNGNQDASAANAESSAACTPSKAPATSNGGSLTRDPQGSASTPDAVPCADAPHTSAQAASAATVNQQQTSTTGRQHAASNFQPAANSVSHVPAHGVPNGTAKQAAANSHKHSELHSPPAGQAQDTANTAGLPEGGTLIVCPTAVLSQWARELEAKVAPPAGMTVYMYHGKGRGVKPQQLARYSCVLTTYTSMGMEAGPRADAKHGTNPGQPIELEDSGNDDDAAATGGKGKKKVAGPLFQIHWWRVVLDESQAIKNAGTLVAHAAHCLQAGRRWCLSGTPIQNSVDDLYSCFRFLRYNPYCKKAAFKSMLKDPLQDNPAKGAQLLQVCLKPVLLRRTKTSTIDGEPVVKLPPREQQLVCKAFSASEQRFYNQVQQESMQKLKALEEGGGSNSYVNMLWLLLRLRQACNHPWLVRGTAAQYGGAGACAPNGALGSPGGKVTASQLSAAKKLAGQQCEQLLQTLQQEPSVCAQCGDISEEAVVSACCHVFCRQCITMQVGSLGGSKESESNFQCPTCSQPLSAAQVFTKPALKKARGQAEGTQQAGGAAQHGWHSSSKVEHLLELLRGMQHRGATGRAPVPGKPPGAAPNPLSGRSKSDMRLAAILGAPPRGSSPALTSSPTQEKVIVFSQWTSMLDLIEMALKKEKFVFRRLDGSMSMANRDQAIIDFQEKSGINILIVSLKAAALGLNLVAANHVVLLDLWWNPTIEEQAIDRAHRIGQTRTVHVTRITIKGTVEERILALQESKRKIVSAAFGDDSGGFQQTARLTKEDLHFLFTGQL